MVYVSLSLSEFVSFADSLSQIFREHGPRRRSRSTGIFQRTHRRQIYLSLSLSYTHTSHTVLCVLNISSLFMVSALRRLGVKGVEIRKPAQLDSVASLIIPGGESTTMAKLAEYHNLVLSLTLYIFIFKKCFLRKYNQTTLKIQLGS